MKLANLDFSQTYTYADYLNWDFDERVELIKGKIFELSPAPAASHQIIAGKMHLKFGSFLENSETCKVFFAPYDVRLPIKSKKDKDIYTVVQPDLCVVCDPAKRDERGCIGAPDIVVEILSPSNNKKELKNKYEVYEESGVKEYWVVIPSEKAITIYVLVDGKYITTRPLFAGDIATSTVLPGFKLDVGNVFEFTM